MYELEPGCRAVLSARPVVPVPVSEGLPHERWAEKPKGAVVAACYRNRKPPHGQAGLFLSRTVSAYENLAEIKKLGRSHPMLSSERVMTGQRLVSASLSPAFGGAFRSPQWHRAHADFSGYHRPAA